MLPSVEVGGMEWNVAKRSLLLHNYDEKIPPICKKINMHPD